MRSSNGAAVLCLDLHATRTEGVTGRLSLSAGPLLPLLDLPLWSQDHCLRRRRL